MSRFRSPIALVILLTLVATFTTRDVVSAAAGPVMRFRIDQSIINTGQCVNVSWHVWDAKAVLFQGQPVKAEETRQDCPAQTTTYTLTAVSAGNAQYMQKRTVRVRAAPVAQPTTPPPANPPGVSNTSTDMANALLGLVNTARAQAGVGPLTLNPALMVSAQGHSNDMAAKNFFSHTGSDGRSPAQRVSAAGYSWHIVGENIAQTWQVNSGEVFGLWMNSPGHRENILNGGFQHMGVGVATGSDGKVYYTQDFGMP
jgi:uncharacterized protein YkwD